MSRPNPQVGVLRFDALVFTPKYSGEELKTIARIAPSAAGGSQARVIFANGYGASIVTGYGAYGGAEGLAELAVLKDGSLCYDTPITSDVEGYLNEADVTRLLCEIAALPSPEGK